MAWIGVGASWIDVDPERSERRNQGSMGDTFLRMEGGSTVVKEAAVQGGTMRVQEEKKGRCPA